MSTNLEQATERQLQRLKQACGVESDTAFAQFMGISQGSVSGAKKKQQLPHSWFFQVAEKTGLPADWLFFGQSGDPMRISANEKDAALAAPGTCAREAGRPSEAGPAGLTGAGRTEHALPVDEDFAFVPMVEARLSAGSGSLETSAKVERAYAFRRDFLARKGNPRHMVLMRVSGTSMEPEICDNDIVLIDQSNTDITPGRLYAVGFEDAIYLKRIDKEPGKVIFKSANPDFQPMEFDLRGDCDALFRVIGRVLWCGREY